MRKIYITVLILFIASLFLFIFSFVYLDKYNHRTFYYNISIGGQYVGTATIDKFVTEEKLIYKSVSQTPFRELFTERRARLNLDRRYNLEDYQEELFANGVWDLYYAESNGDAISFMSKSMSQFTSLSNLPIRRGTFIFKEDVPLTYLPIIETYDFKMGNAQGFNSFIYLPDSRTPPIKRFVTLTSIKDEYIKIGRRKIKTEKLLLKIKGLPPGSVWVAKSDRTLMMIEIPATGLKITRSFEPKEAKPKAPSAAPLEYLSRDVTFPGKTAQLAGTFTTPKDDPSQPDPAGKYPAVLLVWGSGPQDRNYQGLFESIASYLPKYGYCVLRFDKRGVGSSGGDALTTTPDDEVDDLAGALAFLKSQSNVNINRISVVAHSEGALAALRLAKESPDIK
ncbi:MAG: alpha/beta hydrolase, partial [Candidatus Omnitrophica bacterium]|nr:alpha/beta hydrolase [Candidatus Omnitrophota bacterium]